LNTEMPTAHLTLAALTRLTGLSAHVIRAWEARYGYPQPQRTEGGHRRYSREQAERLRQAAVLTRSGLRAADAIAMVRDQPVRALPSVPVESAVAELTSRLVAGEKLGALMQLREAWIAFGLSGSLESLVFPALRRVGELWAAGAISVAEEHAASGIVLSWLGSLRADFPWQERRIHVLIAAPEGEEHVAGVWALELLLGEAGIPALALGANVPTRDLIAEVRRRRPRALVLGIARTELRPVLGKIARTAAGLGSSRLPLILAGGAGVQPPLADGVGALNGPLTEAARQLAAMLRSR
jgi:DNA-binding transcriptional MerR regulator/methylmalonyl-CoA mutase cobalamin-binding subunit